MICNPFNKHKHLLTLNSTWYAFQVLAGEAELIVLVTEVNCEDIQIGDDIIYRSWADNRLSATSWTTMAHLLLILFLIILMTSSAFLRPLQIPKRIPLVRQALTSINQDVLTSCVALGASVAWLQIWITFAKQGKIDPRLSRKIIHCGSGPLFIFLWPLYSSDGLVSRVVAASIPLIQMTRWIHRK